jgi:hypothetical protein
VNHRLLYRLAGRAVAPLCQGNVTELAGGVVFVRTFGRGCTLLQCRRCLRLIVCVKVDRDYQIVCEYPAPVPDAACEDVSNASV